MRIMVIGCMAVLVVAGTNTTMANITPGECATAQVACAQGSSLCKKYRERFDAAKAVCSGVNVKAIPGSEYAPTLTGNADEANRSVPVEIKSRCPDPYMDHWQGSDDPDGYPVIGIGYASAYDPEITTKDPATSATVAASFRDCAGKELSAVRSEPHRYLYSNSQLSDLITEGPLLLMQQAFSELFPPRRADQDPIRAAAYIKAAFVEYQSNMAQARRLLTDQEMELQRRFEEAKEKEDERFASDQRNQMIGAVVGGLLVKKYAGGSSNLPLRAAQQAYQTTANFHDYRLKVINRSNSELNILLGRLGDIEVPAAWTEDGVRLHIPRFDSIRHVSYPALGRQEHTQYIVRVTAPSSGCSGALVGPRLVLTAQHCIFDENGESRGSFTVHWQYLDLDRYSGLETKEIAVNVVRWTTSSGRWKSSWSNDWALLVLESPLTEKPRDFGWLAPLEPQLLPEPGERLAVAGYSGDIDEGEYITMDWGCPVVSTTQGILNHHCKAWKGASGSPIVMSEGPNKGRIVAVHSFGNIDDHTRGGGPSTSNFFDTWYSLAAQQIQEIKQ
jgi:V8-like Glu-specific endopeptidase